MSKFSGALTLTDLNDFITPSQACIKPVEQLNAPSSQQREEGTASTEISIDSTGVYYEKVSSSASTSGSTKLAPAQISLNDCLACSGCITSAESVLITLQSHTEVAAFLASNPSPESSDYKVPVISIAPQCLASLAAAYPKEYPSGALSALEDIRDFFGTKWGVVNVYDTSFARHVALLEHTREFHQRWSSSPQKGKMPMLASACPGWVCYAEKAHPEALPYIANTRSPQAIQGALVKRWMASKWARSVYHVSVMMCYDKKLEASRPDFTLDTQGADEREVDCVITTGELELLMRENGWTPGSGSNSPPSSGDTASTAAKLDLPDLISHPGTSSGSYLHSLISALMDSPPSSFAGLGKDLQRPLTLTSAPIRNADHVSYIVTDASGKVVFKGATCYGFRNLQNVVRKLGKGISGPGGLRARVKRRKLAKEGAEVGQDVGEDRGWDYVEVMACPTGCVNGGGQLKPPAPVAKDAEGYPSVGDVEMHDSIVKEGREVGKETACDVEKQVLQNARWGDKEWTKKVEAEYWRSSELPTPPPSRPSSPPSLSSVACTPAQILDRASMLALRVLLETCRPQNKPSRWDDAMDGGAEKSREELFRTSYRKVESEVNGLGVQW